MSSTKYVFYDFVKRSTTTVYQSIVVEPVLNFGVGVRSIPVIMGMVFAIKKYQTNKFSLELVPCQSYNVKVHKPK